MTRSILLLALLSALTLALHAGAPAEERFRVVGDEMVGVGFDAVGEDAWRIDGGEALGWPACVTGDVVRLEVGGEREHASALLRVPLAGGRAYEVRFDLRCSDITASDGPGDADAGARVVFASLDEDGAPRYDLPYSAGDYRDAREWSSYAAILPVAPGARDADVGIHLTGTSGWVELGVPSVRALVPDRRFALASTALLCGWIVALLAGARAALASDVRVGAKAALGIALACVVVGCTLPSAWAGVLSEGVRTLLGDAAGGAVGGVRGRDGVPSADAIEFQFRLRKVGHALFFALLAVIAFAPIGRRRVVRTLAFCLAVGLLTEVLQFLSPGRVPSLGDVAIDMAGATLAVTLLVVARGVRPKREGDAPPRARDRLRRVA